MTWFASISMLLQHFPRKLGACTVRHGRCVSGVKAVSSSCFGMLGGACYVILLSLIAAFSLWCGPETNESDLSTDSPADLVPVPRAA